MSRFNYKPIQKGLKYNFLTVLKDLGMINNVHMVSAICVCGVIKSYQIAFLKTGNTKSCGCYQIAATISRSKTHGLYKHPLYTNWASMLSRCYYEKATGFKHWGGKGVKVCDEWRNNFKAFYDWSITNGWEAKLHLDRFPNNEGDYTPDNCRWATPKQNNRNKIKTKMLVFNGEKKPLSEWGEIYNIPHGTLCHRINTNWSIKDALEIKPNKHNRKSDQNIIIVWPPSKR